MPCKHHGRVRCPERFVVVRSLCVNCRGRDCKSHNKLGVMAWDQLIVGRDYIYYIYVFFLAQALLLVGGPTNCPRAIAGAIDPSCLVLSWKLL